MLIQHDTTHKHAGLLLCWHYNPWFPVNFLFHHSRKAHPSPWRGRKASQSLSPRRASWRAVGLWWCWGLQFSSPKHIRIIRTYVHLCATYLSPWDVQKIDENRTCGMIWYHAIGTIKILCILLKIRCHEMLQDASHFLRGTARLYTGD